MNKKIYGVGMLLLFVGVLFFQTTTSEQSTFADKTQNGGYDGTTPLFSTRLLEAERKPTALLRTYFFQQDHMSISVPPFTQYTSSRLHQNSYTSYHTGACVHPTQCPCITSGVFCGGKPTCGLYCALPTPQNEYQKNLT